MQNNILLIVTLCIISGAVLLFPSAQSLAFDDDPVSPDGVLLPDGTEDHYGTVEELDPANYAIYINDQQYIYTENTKFFDLQNQNVLANNFPKGNFVLFYTFGDNQVYKVFQQQAPDGEEPAVDTPPQQSPQPSGGGEIRFENGVWTN